LLGFALVVDEEKAEERFVQDIEDDPIAEIISRLCIRTEKQRPQRMKVRDGHGGANADEDEQDDPAEEDVNLALHLFQLRLKLEHLV